MIVGSGSAFNCMGSMYYLLLDLKNSFLSVYISLKGLNTKKGCFNLDPKFLKVEFKSWVYSYENLR